MAWTWMLTLLVIFLVHLILRAIQSGKDDENKKRLPPGPKALPILGHLHLLGKNPDHDLRKLAKRYGPVMYLRFGFVPIIVVSSPQAAEQFLKTNDHVFASRPPHEGAKYMSYDQKNITFAEYGTYWREIRKLFTLELLSNHKINSFRDMRRQEVGLLVKELEKAARAHAVVDLSEMVASANAEMSCLMIFGKKYKDEDFGGKGFKAEIKEGMHLTAAPNLGDYFPYLSKLDLQGITRRMKAVAKIFDGFLERVIDEHVESSKEEQKTNKDFVDTLLGIMESGETEFSFDRAHIKAILLDTLIGSMDTSAAAIEWTLSELIKHPRVMKEVQKELQEIVGLERMVEESDLNKLEYFDMVVKEVFRLHPVGPLLVPHESMDDCTINGYHIPKRSRILINVGAIGRDPNVWNEAEKFFPERFIGSDIDVRGRDFQLIPFGSGRRSCPGMQLGLTVVRFVVAQLVHCFDWELPNKMLGHELDMTEDFGLVVSRAEHLKAIPTCRLGAKSS